MLTHLVLLGVPAHVITTLYKKGVLFTYHPTAMTLAYLGIMGEGVLLAKAAYGKNKPAKLQQHLWAMGAASAVAVAGHYAIYKVCTTSSF